MLVKHAAQFATELKPRAIPHSNVCSRVGGTHMHSSTHRLNWYNRASHAACWWDQADNEQVKLNFRQ